MSSFNHFIRKKFCSLFDRSKFSAVLCELESIAKLLVFIATVALFFYAMFCPSFWIILIIFVLFLAVLALVYH